MRDESRGYEYNIDVSRSLAQRSAGSMTHVGTSMTQHPLDLQMLNAGGLPNGLPTYRSNGYSLGPKGYYPLGGEWADPYAATDGPVDYGLGCAPYPDLTPGYAHWTARQKTSYLDSDAGYGYGAGATTSLVHRPAVHVSGASGDSSAYSMTNLSASLASANNERLLPNPVSRTLASSSSYLRGDGLTPGYSSSKSSHANIVSSGTAGPASPVSPDVTAAAAAAGYASSAYDYANSVRASQHGSSSTDAYASVSAGGGETIFGDADRNAATQGPAVDLTGYTYGGGSPADASLRRASSGSGLTTRSAANSNASSAGYVVSDAGGGASSPYHHSASSHGHHHQSHSSHHHNSPRHGGHHHLSQQHHAVAGATAYGEASGNSNTSSGVGHTTTAVSSHRTSLPGHGSRR